MRQDGLPFEVEVLRLEELLRPPFTRKTTTPNRTRFHTILLVEQGNSFHHIDFEPRAVKPGDLLIIPEGRVQAFDHSRAIRGYLLLFTENFLRVCGLRIAHAEDSGRQLLQDEIHIHLKPESTVIIEKHLALLAHHSGSMISARFTEQSITSAFSLLLFAIAGMQEITDAISAQQPNDPLVAKFFTLLEQNFRTQHIGSFYAEQLSVSPRTLDRHLLSDQDQSTRQFIAARLLLEAKRLLTKRDIPIKNIAYELGFSEPQNFTRFFRAQTSTSPQQFRGAVNRAR